MIDDMPTERVRKLFEEAAELRREPRESLQLEILQSDEGSKQDAP